MASGPSMAEWQGKRKASESASAILRANCSPGLSDETRLHAVRSIGPAVRPYIRGHFFARLAAWRVSSDKGRLNPQSAPRFPSNRRSRSLISPVCSQIICTWGHSLFRLSILACVRLGPIRQLLACPFEVSADVAASLLLTNTAGQTPWVSMTFLRSAEPSPRRRQFGCRDRLKNGAAARPKALRPASRHAAQQAELKRRGRRINPLDGNGRCTRALRQDLECIGVEVPGAVADDEPVPFRPIVRPQDKGIRIVRILEIVHQEQSLARAQLSDPLD